MTKLEIIKKQIQEQAKNINSTDSRESVKKKAELIGEIATYSLTKQELNELAIFVLEELVISRKKIMEEEKQILNALKN